MAARALATAYVNIVPGTQQVEQYLRTGLGGQVGDAGVRAGAQFGTGFKSRFGSMARSIAAPLIASLSVAGATQFFTQAVQGASDLNEQASAVGQVFGSGASAIQKFADGAATSLGQSKVQILEASKSFGIFGKAAGLTGSANAEFSTSLVTLATDLASFNNTSVDEALIALQAGLRGESEPLRRFGVLLDDQTLRAKALEMGLISSTKNALTPQQKVLASNAVIFAQTAAQQGDFARTSGGLANQQRILTAEWTNAQATLGQSLIPTMTQLVTWLNTSVIPAIQQFFVDFQNGQTPLNAIINGVQAFIGFIQQNWSWVSTLAVAIGSVWAAFTLMNVAAGIYNGIMTAMATIQGIQAAATMVQEGATFSATAAQWGFNAALLANPLTWIVIAILAVIAALVWFFTQTDVGKKIWQGFVDFLVGAWNWVVDGFKAAFEWIGSMFKGYVNFWLTIIEGFINFFIDGINGLLGMVNAGLGFLGNAIGLDLKIGMIPHVKLPRLAKGGFVNSPTIAQIGEAGPEVVTPLKEFERMMGMDKGGKDRPIMADGIGLIGWMREEAKGQATIVFNKEIGKTSRGVR